MLKRFLRLVLISSAALRRSSLLLLWIALPAHATLPVTELQTQLADGVQPPLAYWTTTAEQPPLAPDQIIDAADFAPWQALPNPWKTTRYNNSSSVWFAFEIHNTAAQLRNLMLFYDHPRMAELDVYIIRNGRIAERWLTGASRAWSSRAIPNSAFVFPVTVHADETIEVLLRTTGHSSYLPKHFSVSDLGAWQRINEISRLPDLIVSGFMTCILLYSATFFYSARNRLSFYVFVYMLALTALLFWVSGNTWLIFPNLYGDPLLKLAAISASVALSAMTLILIQILALPQRHPSVSTLLHFYTLCYVLFFALSSIAPWSATNRLYGLFLGSGVAVFLALAIGSLFRRNVRQYLGFAWSPLVVLMSYYLLSATQLLPSISGVSEICLILHCMLLIPGMSRYLTDFRDQARQARAELAAQSAFMARMSHEIRTPMNAVLGLTELLKDTHLDERQQSYLNTIYTAGSALLTILNDILDYAKIESGQMQLEQVSFDLAQFGAECVSIFKAQTQQQQIELTYDCASYLPATVIGDPTRLRQVLVNLISNALKFTPHGTVTLKLTPTAADRIHFSITDTGEGLTPAEQSLLFQRFSQAHDRVARQHGGTGLGLAICKELVQLMGGEIGVISEKGHGSTFWFELPLPTIHEAQSTLAANQTTPVTAVQVGDVQLELLLVDDNSINRLIAGAMLTKLGHRHACAEDGAQALAAYQQEPDRFAAILMDCEMPVLDGWAATRTIRAWEHQQHRAPIPIIALTAHALSEERNRSEQAGMTDFLSKPLLLPQLYKALSQLTRSDADVTQQQ